LKHGTNEVSYDPVCGKLESKRPFMLRITAYIGTNPVNLNR
jgi:hypothetical protein